MHEYRIDLGPWAQKWLKANHGTNGYTKVIKNLDYMAAGNLGTTRQITGNLYEKKIRTKGGYRIYYYIQLVDLIRVIGIGDKSTQKRDIIRATDIWKKETRKQT